MTTLDQEALPGMPWAPPPYEPGDWPHYREHVTADRLIARLAKTGSERVGRSQELIDDLLKGEPDKDDPRWPLYHSRVVGFIGEFSTIFLLLELAKVVAPQKLQEIAVDLWECIESGDTAPECLWDWAHGDFGGEAV